jgi:hypothetical protein
MFANFISKIKNMPVNSEEITTQIIHNHQQTKRASSKPLIISCYFHLFVYLNVVFAIHQGSSPPGGAVRKSRCYAHYKKYIRSSAHYNKAGKLLIVHPAPAQH